MDFDGFIHAMRGALYQCGQAARALQGRVAEQHKSPDSIHQQSTVVTVADRLCQELVLLRAYEVAPGIEIYSEEMASCPPEIVALYAGNSHHYALILDPIDGTEDFAQGAATYAHMLGLLDQETGQMACGMIYFPEHLRFYLGQRGAGVFVSDGLWGAWRRLEPAHPPKTVAEIKRLTPGDYDAIARAGYQLVPRQSRSAAWELIRVVEGELGAVAMRHFHGHDSAMASVMIEALGGLALDVCGQPVRYTRDMPRLPLVVSSLVPDLARDLAALLGTN